MQPLYPAARLRNPLPSASSGAAALFRRWGTPLAGALIASVAAPQLLVIDRLVLFTLEFPHSGAVGVRQAGQEALALLERQLLQLRHQPGDTVLVTHRHSFLHRPARPHAGLRVDPGAHEGR